MHPRIPLVAMLFLAGTPALAQQGGTAHVDHEGNPLPAEAIARIGSSRLLRVASRLYQAAYTPDGRRIVGVLADKLHVWDAATGKLLHTIAAEIKATPTLAWRGDAAVLFSGGIVRTFDIMTGKELRRLELPDTSSLFCAALGPGGETLAVGKLPGPVRLLDVATGKEKRRWQCRDNIPVSLAFAPDGKTLAVSTAANVIQLVDTTAATPPPELEVGKLVTHLNISPDQRTLLAAGEAKDPVILWDLASRKERARLQMKESQTSVPCSAFSPDGKLVALGGAGKFVELYDVATGQEVRRFCTWPSCQSLAFSPDGTTLLANVSGKISQWDVASGRLLAASANPYPGFQVLRFVDQDRHLPMAATTCASGKSPQAACGIDLSAISKASIAWLFRPRAPCWPPPAPTRPTSGTSTASTSRPKSSPPRSSAACGTSWPGTRRPGLSRRSAGWRAAPGRR